MSESAAGSPPVVPSSYERWNDRLTDWSPYVTLALASVVTLARTPGSAGDRLVTAGLVVVAALWVYLGYTRAARPRQAHQVRMVTYFVGLLAIASVLAVREYLFFIFLITGFFHALVLRPWPVLIAGVFATSVLVNTVIGGLPTNAEWWTIYVVIIVVQTLAIGGGGLLSERMAEQSEQRRLAVAQLAAALEENAGLHAMLLAQAREAGVLDERQRMAGEIHDTIAQGLTGIVTQLEAAEQARDRPEAWQRHVRNAVGLAQSLSEARRSVEGSRPEHLETARLPDALGEVAHQWSGLNGVPVEVVTTGDVQPLHAEVEVALLRTAQEALANVARHASASRAWLTLSYMGDVVTLDVRDDGAGFKVPDDPDARGAGFGLTAMRQRVNRVAGTLDIESEPGGGTAVSARVPAIVAPGSVLPVTPIRLLIVDDHPVVRDGLRGMFSGDPEFEVVGEARDGAEAVTLAGELLPDVIRMDLRMPGVNGAAAIRELSERNVPSRVLVLTTYDTDSDVVPAIEAGATGYLLKDSPREELVRAVRAASRGESVLASSVATRLMSQLREPTQDALSERELEVLALIAQGLTNCGAAARLFISEATVKTYLLHIYAKLDVNDAPRPSPRRSSATCCRSSGRLTCCRGLSPGRPAAAYRARASARLDPGRVGPRAACPRRTVRADGPRRGGSAAAHPGKPKTTSVESEKLGSAERMDRDAIDRGPARLGRAPHLVDLATEDRGRGPRPAARPARGRCRSARRPWSHWRSR